MIKCALCPAEAIDTDDAIQLEWSPSFFIGDEEVSDPICPDCFLYFMVPAPDGEWEMRYSLIDKTPYGNYQGRWAKAGPTLRKAMQTVQDEYIYRAACSGLRYRSPEPCGEVSEILVEGKWWPIKREGLDEVIEDLLERCLSVLEEDDEHGSEHIGLIEELRQVLGKPTTIEEAEYDVPSEKELRNNQTLDRWSIGISKPPSNLWHEPDLPSDHQGV